MDIFTTPKFVPFALASYLTYKIAMCPCKAFMECQTNLTLSILGVLTLMVLLKFPIQ